MSKKRLGRGLDSLLSTPKAAQTDAEDKPVDTAAPTQIAQEPALEPAAGTSSLIQKAMRASSPAPDGVVPELDVNQIRPSPYQPRRHFDEESLGELSQSIASQGLLQPVVVRKLAQGGYELIAGERRWRAAQLAGLKKIPAMVKTVTDRQASALALIENVQREDLSALEEAMGLARLRDEFELTQQQIADAVGKSRVAIANLLRLLNLGATARGLLEAGQIEMGHARALLGLEGIAQDQAARQAAEQGLSVRQTEALVKRAGQPPATPASTNQIDPDVQRLEQRVTDKIGAPVAIKQKPNGQGELTIKFSNLDELEGVLSHLGVPNE
ncbi:MAG: ParB/RepB/Spo0J family partition protein [Pseudomonadota bacterium]